MRVRRAVRVAWVAALFASACRAPSPAAADVGTERRVLEQGSASDGVATVDATTEAVPAAGARPPDLCGVCYAHNWQGGGDHGYGSEASAQTLAELDALGVTSVSLTPFGWMRDVHDTQIRWDPERRGTETFDSLRAEAARARAAGMEVMLKPHLWIGGGAWRGDIAPDPAAGGWDAFFASYSEFIVAHAALAEEIGAEWFVVGVELVSVTDQAPAQMRALIASVREVYHGRLTYAANWDEAERVPWWDALDAVGVQMFAPLRTVDQEPSDAVLLQGAVAWRDRFDRLAAGVDRPLLLTEVGYVNREGTTVDPWLWPDRGAFPHTDAGDAEQAAAYRAVFDAFSASERLERAWWWKWFTDPSLGEEGPVGYPPTGRTAATVLGERCASETGAE